MGKNGKARNWLPIRQQMVLIVCLIFIVTILGTVIAGVASGYRGLVRTVEDDLTTIGQLADQTFSAAITDAKTNAQHLSGNYDYSRQTGEVSAEALQETAAQLADYDFLEVALFTKDGRVTTSTDFLRDAGNLSCVSAALNGTITLSTSVAFGNELRFLVAAPCQDGALVMTLDGSYFSSLIQNVSVGKSGNIFLIDNTGTMIANIRPALVSGRENFIEKAKTDKAYRASGAIYTKMTQGESGIGTYAYGGDMRICYYGTVSSSDGWSYGAVAPLKEMTTHIGVIVAALGITSLICLVLGMAGISKFAQRLTGPVVRLSERMRKLASGDLSSPVEVSERRDEIGTLTENFHTTVEAVKSYIQDISNVLQAMSDGNLLVKPEVVYEGDFSEIRTSLENILSALNGVFGKIGTAADQVSAGAEQVSAGAQTLSQGATEQASSVEELAATIQDISSNVKVTAENTVTASDRVGKAHDLMEECTNQMNDMVNSMAEISQNSQEIGKIIKTIEDIAFQTNILALNAAVEAARAGDAGKGFAVVADEVRNLATKSAEASKNTAVLIEAAMASVSQGTSAVERTAQTIDDVGTNAAAVAEIVEKIAAAAAQQSNALEQVTAGVDQISSVVQNTSATSEQSAAASEEMSAQAEMLKDLVNRIQFEGKQSK